VRIPSWLEADPALHSEAVYIEADRFFHQKILLAIGRRTIHGDPNHDPLDPWKSGLLGICLKDFQNAPNERV
jgi:hypothetical protein